MVSLEVGKGVESHAPGGKPEGEIPMPMCRECEDEVEELVKVKVGRRTLKLCEDCADRIREEMEIAEESEAVIQDMMGFKGRR
jgi:hypothetical protein